MAYRIAVVGAANIDISATSNAILLPGDSNPGKVEQSFGGVGRNIAENLARLDTQVSLVTAFGGDAFAALLKNQAQKVGLDASHGLDCPTLSSSVYICVNQPDGEINVAVSDMGICQMLSPAFLQKKLSMINACDALVVEANLTEEALGFLGLHVTVPIFADSVSVQKARKLHGILPRLAGLKTNRREAERLTGLSIATRKDVVSAAEALHGLGVESVLLTLGAEGGFLSKGNARAFAPSQVGEMINTTGCGDACLAGMVYAYLGGVDCQGILASGMAMAGICASSPFAVSPLLTPKRLADDIAKTQEDE